MRFLSWGRVSSFSVFNVAEKKRKQTSRYAMNARNPTIHEKRLPNTSNKEQPT